MEEHYPNKKNHPQQDGRRLLGNERTPVAKHSALVVSSPPSCHRRRYCRRRYKHGDSLLLLLASVALLVAGRSIQSSITRQQEDNHLVFREIKVPFPDNPQTIWRGYQNAHDDNKNYSNNYSNNNNNNTPNKSFTAILYYLANQENGGWPAYPSNTKAYQTVLTWESFAGRARQDDIASILLNVYLFPCPHHHHHHYHYHWQQKTHFVFDFFGRNNNINNNNNNNASTTAHFHQSSLSYCRQAKKYPVQLWYKQDQPLQLAPPEHHGDSSIGPQQQQQQQQPPDNPLIWFHEMWRQNRRPETQLSTDADHDAFVQQHTHAAILYLETIGDHTTKQQEDMAQSRLNYLSYVQRHNRHIHETWRDFYNLWALTIDNVTYPNVGVATLTCPSRSRDKAHGSAHNNNNNNTSSVCQEIKFLPSVRWYHDGRTTQEDLSVDLLASEWWQFAQDQVSIASANVVANPKTTKTTNM